MEVCIAISVIKGRSIMPALIIAHCVKLNVKRTTCTATYVLVLIVSLQLTVDKCRNLSYNSPLEIIVVISVSELTIFDHVAGRSKE